MAQVEVYCITNQLYMGPAPTDWERVWKFFDVVITLIRQPVSVPEGKLQVVFPITDDENLPPSDELTELAVFVSKLVIHGRNVFIHCGAGFNRSGLVAALAYRELEGCTGAEALNVICDVRPLALCNPWFRKYLREVDEKCF